MATLTLPQPIRLSPKFVPQLGEDDAMAAG